MHIGYIYIASASRNIETTALSKYISTFTVPGLFVQAKLCRYAMISLGSLLLYRRNYSSVEILSPLALFLTT
jgi:hypothetical protein